MRWPELVACSKIGGSLRNVRFVSTRTLRRRRDTGAPARLPSSPSPLPRRADAKTNTVLALAGSAVERLKLEESEGRLEDSATEHDNGIIPHKFLERWSTLSAPQSKEQRIHANKFFTSHPKDMLFSAGGLHQVTFTDVPEVAFVGRSNVGKSTLLNALLGQGVARTGKRPGKTRTLNAWAVGGMDRTGKKHRLTVLDMPGYGYGARPSWGDTVTKYLHQRKELKRVFVLINAEHDIKDTDKRFLASLRAAAIPHQIILNKLDNVLTSGKNGKNTQTICGKANLARVADQLDSLVSRVRMESSKGGVPALNDVLICSGTSTLPREPPEPKGSLGITTLRWAVLEAAGLRPQRNVKDESELSFS